MTRDSQETIACCVGSPTASWTMLSAVRAAGARATTVTRRQVLNEFVDEACWAALILELQSGDPDTKALVAAFRKRQPGTPILLYTPMSAEAGPMLEQLLGREGVYVHLQCECGNHVQSLRDNVCRLLSHTPAVRLKRLVVDALPDMPDRLQDYVGHILMDLASDDGPLQLTTATVAANMGLVVRTLERASAAAGYPRPKELLSWMVLLYLTLLGCCNQTTPYKVARRLGMSTCTMNRLRHRLLSRHESEAWKHNRDNGRFRFELVFTAFMNRCGAPADAAMKAFAGMSRAGSYAETLHTPALAKAVSWM